MRYLPTIGVFIVLIAGWVVSDRVQTEALQKEKREATIAMLRLVQNRIAQNLAQTVREARALAVQIDSPLTIDQQGFEKIVKNIGAGTSRIDRVELAPNFVTRLVYPLEGNETYIGKSPLRMPANGLSPLESDVARGFPTLSGMNMLDNGLAELQVRSELREVEGSRVVSTGLVYLVKQFELSNSMGEFLDGTIDFFYQIHPSGEQPPVLPEQWQTQENMEPLQSTVELPPGDIMLYARPANGWSVTASEATPHRLRFLGLGLLLLLPVILANGFAVYRGATRGRLSQTQNQMSGFLQNLPGAAFTYTIAAGQDGPSRKDRVSFLNPEACKDIWGVDAKSAERNPKIIWDLIANEEASAELAEAISSTMHSMQPFDKIWPINTVDGELKWLRCRALPARDEDGAIYWSALIFDNTDAVERENELEQQREYAFRAQKNETIGQLTGGIAHDFNNLLAVILGNLEVLQTNPNHRERDDILQEAINSTLRGADLTRKMLAFARRARLTPEILHLNELVHEVHQWIDRTLPATLTVVMKLEDDLWPVSADRSSTESALLNLMVNARDAMDERGLLTVETANVEVEEPDARGQLSGLAAGGYVVLSVADTGSGIAGDQLRNIFEPFFSTKEIGRGSGLGLSMVTGFMQQSGGAVKVESEQGKGAIFKLYFPAAGQEVSAPAATVKVTPGYRVGSRILLAEDDPSVRDMLRRLLEGEGYRVLAVNSGDEALDAFNRNPPFDLLLTDLVMTGEMQGRELANELQQRSPGLAVIYISGYCSEFLQMSSELDANFIGLTKPVKRVELIAAVESALNYVQKKKVVDTKDKGIPVT